MTLLQNTATHDLISDPEFWTKILSIDNLFCTGGSAVLVMFLSDLLRRFVKIDAMLSSFLLSFLIAILMIQLSNYTGFLHCFLLALGNAVLITAIAYTSNDVIFKVKKKAKKKKQTISTKMGGADKGNNEKDFFSPWL